MKQESFKRLVYYDEKMRIKLEKIMNKLIIGKSFKYVGTFAHKMKYVTDIDISNFIYSKKCPSFQYFVYNKILNIINNLPKDIDLLYLTTGKHPDLIPKWNLKNPKKIENYNHKITVKMLDKLKKNNKINSVLYREFKKKPVDVKKLILLEEFLDKKSRLSWKKEEIKKGFKYFLDDKFYLKNTLFEPPLKNFMRFIWKYDEKQYVLIDISFYFNGNLDCIKSIKNYKPVINEWDREKKLFLMYYNEEYYWLLRETRYLFINAYKKRLIEKKSFEALFQSIIEITETDAGIYKFLYNKILDYYKLIRNNGLDLEIINELIIETLDNINKYIIDEEITEQCKKLKENININNKEKIIYLKNISALINEFLNNLMYEEMIKYYSILFEIDSNIQKNLPPIMNMKKPKKKYIKYIDKKKDKQFELEIKSKKDIKKRRYEKINKKAKKIIKISNLDYRYF